MIGRRLGVRKATTARVMVRAIIPVSDMKNRAGGILNHKKASKLPTMTKQNVAKSI